MSVKVREEVHCGGAVESSWQNLAGSGLKPRHSQLSGARCDRISWVTDSSLNITNSAVPTGCTTTVGRQCSNGFVFCLAARRSADLCCSKCLTPSNTFVSRSKALPLELVALEEPPTLSATTEHEPLCKSSCDNNNQSKTFH